MVSRKSSSIRPAGFATARQKIKIAQLCMALGLREPLEERVATASEASQLIQELITCISASRNEGSRKNGHCSSKGCRCGMRTRL